MAGTPQIIDQIVQFTGATATEWADVLIPIPDRMMVLDADGNIKRGDGVTLWVDLPVLFNADVIAEYATELISKAPLDHYHTISAIEGLTNALDALSAAIATKASSAEIEAAIADAVTDPSSAVVTALNEKVGTATYNADQASLIAAVNGKVSTATFNATISTKADTTGAILIGAAIKDERLIQYDHGTVSSGTVVINTADGNVQRLQVGGNLTLTFTWPSSNDSTVLLRLINGGAAALTIPSVSFIASDGMFQATPNASLQPSGTDFIVVMRLGGVTYAKVIR